MSKKPIDLAAWKQREGILSYYAIEAPLDNTDKSLQRFYDGCEAMPTWAMGTKQAVCLNPEDEQDFRARGIQWKAVRINS